MNKQTQPGLLALTQLCLVAALAASSGAWAQAPAQAPQTTRVAGTIAQVNGQSLVIETADHQKVPLTLAPQVQLVGQSRVTLVEVKPGRFIGVTAAPGKDGKLHASEVHIFPESMRGAGEGHYPWQGPAETTMTNGNVAAAHSTATMTNGNVGQASGGKAGAGLTVKVDYKGGTQDINVGSDVPVTLMGPAERSALVVGAPVMAIASPPQGTQPAVAQTILLQPAKP
jgi:hypothetical protein